MRQSEQTWFEEDFKTVKQFTGSIIDYSGHSLQKCIEQKNKYLLLVNWNRLEHHTIAFGQSVQYLEWKQLMHHYFDLFSVVEHFEMLLQTDK